MAIELQSKFPCVLKIDGREVRIRAKRMTNLEYDEFAAGWDHWTERRGGEDENPEVKRARELEISAWMRDALHRYLDILPEELKVDGREVTDGAELLDLYGGRVDVIPQALTVILMENRLTDEQKKTYRSGLDSYLGSLTAGPSPAAPGTAPATVASVAALSASAPAAAVTDSLSDALSGTTDPSSSAHVPSLH